MSNLPKGWICPRCKKVIAPNISCCDCKPNQIITPKVRVKKEKEPIAIPSEEEFCKYFTDNDEPAETGHRAYKGYIANGWRDVNNKPVINWKGKVRNSWFKYGNKSNISGNEKPKEQFTPTYK